MGTKKTDIKHNGYLHGVELLEFDGKVIGQISDEGVSIGGDEPSTVKIYSAQNRTAPVVNLPDSPGSTEFAFKLIELLPDNLVATLGGRIDGTKWISPSRTPSKTGKFRVITLDGAELSAGQATLTAVLRGNAKHNELLHIECKLTLVSDGNEGAMVIDFAPEKTGSSAGSSPVPGVGG